MKSADSSGQQWLLLSSIILLLVPGVRNGYACLSSPCIHGVCMDDLNSTYFCYCIDGYTGIQCQTNWNECWSSPCQNGGVCIDGIAMFNCSCPPGFAGELCEEDINECESNPCLNNGTCLDAQNGYTCNCLPGYSGVHCEVDVAVCNATNETRCLNGGICEEGPGETFTCYCQPGWGGFLCNSEMDECISAPCQNGAVCIDLHADYSCACLFGFTGRNCEEVIQICEKNPCKNGALCLLEDGHPVCYCVPDFHGELCQFQYDECQLGPRCMNGGTCIDGIDNFTCSCPPNLTGVLCECLILGDNKLDCTYVSPTAIGITTSTIFYDNVTMRINYTTIVPSTVTSSYFETTKVPTTETVIRTETTDFFNKTLDTTVTTLSTSSETVIPYSPTVFTTEPSTTFFTSTANVFEGNVTMSESTMTTGISTSISTTELITTTTTTTTTTELPTTSTEFTTETTDLTITTVLTTEYPLTSTEPVYTTEYSTTLPPLYTNETISTTTELTTEIITTTIESTTLPNITMLPTTQFTDTTMIGDTTVFITTTEEKETNRTFPGEETTYFSSVSTFLTTEPTRKMESSTFISTTITALETTTALSTERTTSIATDCTKFDSHCQNGGTCIYTGEEHRCICPFDTEGQFCEARLGVRNAAFNGESYLSHRLLNYSHVLIEFDAKTMSSGGLLFHSNVDTTYMALYVQDGFLRFKFSCGYQTMLLSELKVPVNNGYTMKIKAELEFSKDLKHCDATIKVNNSLSMTGDQIAKVDQFLKPSAWLHLGGLPQERLYEILPISGFVGCMSNLKISGKKINIYKDAEDGLEVTECSSLACLSNPCKNGASCTSIDDSWQCHCKNGYLGKTCEISICDNNPCLFGGTCIPFTNNGYICLCPYGKHGHFCENDLKISEPYFSSTVRGLSSYVAYPIPDGISKNMELKFRFTPTTMEQISLLLFIGQSGYHDFYSDHLAVSFVKGFIMLTWNLGSGPRRIFTSQPIKKGSRDYLVRLGHSGRRAWLYVENLGNVTGRTPGNLIQLDISPVIFIGGHDSRNFSLLPHDLPLHTGFSGCIFDIEMKSGSVVIPIQGSRNTFGRAVGQCGTTECYEQSCQNGGACLHHGSTFMCLCQDNWYGPLCSSKNNLCDTNVTKCVEKSTCVPLLSNYECDCPLGATGQYCENDENVTDVSLTGKRSFITLHPLEMENTRFHIELEIRILEDQGIVIFIGKASGFVCLSLLNGVLELRIQSSKSKIIATTPTTIRSSKLLVKGVWHKVQFGLFGRKAYVSVDSVINTGLLDMGYILSVSKENIFIGGLPDMSDFPLLAAASLPVHYTGCIRHLLLDDKHIPLTGKHIKEARNVIDCDGTPCGGDACLHGGTCWLDSFMKPHCSCIAPYYGDKCEMAPDCDEKMCKNQGRCYNNKCSCNVGFNGAFCENKITVKTPEFTGQSYLVVTKSSDKKRELRNIEIKKIYLNFTTAKPEGLLIWNKKDNGFLGLGIERGLLKFTYSPSNTKDNIVEVPFYYQVSDGLWHNMEINFAPFSLKLDNKLLEMRNKMHEILNNTIISTNEEFYIGGIPTNTSLVIETNGMFLNAFEGCIEGFGTNTDIIRDFSHYDGSNIQTCELF